MFVVHIHQFHSTDYYTYHTLYQPSYSFLYHYAL